MIHLLTIGLFRVVSSAMETNVSVLSGCIDAVESNSEYTLNSIDIPSVHEDRANLRSDAQNAVRYYHDAYDEYRNNQDEH